MKTLYETINDVHESILKYVNPNIKMDRIKEDHVLFKVNDTVIAKAYRLSTGYGWFLQLHQ